MVSLLSRVLERYQELFDRDSNNSYSIFSYFNKYVIKNTITYSTSVLPKFICSNSSSLSTSPKCVIATSHRRNKYWKWNITFKKQSKVAFKQSKNRQYRHSTTASISCRMQYSLFRSRFINFMRRPAWFGLNNWKFAVALYCNQHKKIYQPTNQSTNKSTNQSTNLYQRKQGMLSDDDLLLIE